MQLFSCKWNILHIQSEREKTFLQGRHSNSPTHQLSAVWKFSCINTSVKFSERVSQFGPKDSVSEGEASPSLLCEAKVRYIRWSLTNSSYWRDVEDVEVHTAARFIWNSSAFSLFSSSSLFSHIQSDHHLTAYYCNDITHRGLYGGVVYRAVSTRGRGLYGGVVCTAAAGSVCSVHINEMFHMKPC